MVKKLVLFLLYVLFFMMAFIYFSPKVNIYYFAEQQLQKKGIVLNDETLSDEGFTLEIKNAVLYVKSLETAKIQKIKLNLFLLYNSVEVEGLVLSDMASGFIPLHVKSLYLVHTVFDPLHVKGKCSGEFGEADINIDLVKRTLQVLIKPSKKMLTHYRTTLRNLKKDKNGGFVYEQSF
ncbi:hypothetical protein FJR45_06850 [Sulfurimonas sediminis]|uniref:DUF3971 domain-containing protein n=1 Tax=Sulfurimonas sediminis TaxID=2590020 RepID=A0A7M1B1S6_9BACT|nr:hypothetical protein [Sulfurimonas sediminis]QOP43684.1 hypothetical protein FJR45_06850 [Sulfurimonas sediminis]